MSLIVRNKGVLHLHLLLSDADHPQRLQSSSNLRGVTGSRNSHEIPQGAMADLLEAMGFPSDWCEHALRTCGGLEAAVDLLLQWQAHGAPNPLPGTIQASTPTLRLSHGSDQSLSSTRPAIPTSANASAIGDSSDAVVPDAFAELRRQRTAAAAKAKKEKESEKEKIRRQLQEDMEMRQYRQNLGKTAETSACGAEHSAARHSKSSSSAELQIRCPGFETIKASFAAGATLKEVRAYVEHALKKPRCPSAGPLRTRTPFSGKSAKLSDSDVDRELLNAAREQFEIQTSRIIAEAQALRQGQTPDSSEHKSNKAIYFLIPLPRQEFFTEALMETTLAEAQLVPRGTLTVHFKECLEGRPAESHAESPSDVVDTISQDAYQLTVLPGDRRECRENSTVEVEGDRERLRERALQAAAKRMSESAEFFREGLPPDGSEVAVSFRFPVDYTSNDSVCTDEVATAPKYASAMQSGNESGPRDAMRSHIMQAAEARLHSQDQQTSCMEGLQNVQDLPSPPKSRVRIPASSRLLCRPEKLQRVEPHEATNREEVTDTGASDARDVDKGKGLLYEHNFQEAGPSSTNTVNFETPIPQSSLRVRLEDGSAHLHIFRADSTLQSVLQSLIPEGTDAALYGLVLLFPEPHFVEGEALMITLEDAGLVPRGTVHLSQISSRGVIRQGRRPRRRSSYSRRRSRSFDIDDVEDHRQGYDSAEEMSYEEILELEESIGRVHVGVPETAISTFPTRIVQTKTRQNDEGGEQQPEVCVVCMGEYVAGEEAMSLPCFHSFHSSCIRRWLSQSTSCPTCKQSVNSL